MGKTSRATLVECRLQVKSGSGDWHDTPISWKFPLLASVWGQLTIKGSSLSFGLAEGDLLGECIPPDLHKYTVCKGEDLTQILTVGHDSYLDYPENRLKGSEPEAS